MDPIVSPAALRGPAISPLPDGPGKAGSVDDEPSEPAREPEGSSMEEQSEDDSELTPSPGYQIEERDDARRRAVRVTLGTLSVMLRERAKGTIQLDPGDRGAGARQATGTHDWQEALEVAEDWLREALDRKGGLEEAAEVARSDDRTPTLRHLVGVYWEEAYPHLTDHEQTNMELVVDLVATIWGLDTLVPAIDRKHVDDFIRVRVEEGVTFPDRMDRSDLAPVKPVTARQNLEDFARVTRHAVQRRLEDGTPLLREDPFASIDWPSGAAFEKEHQKPIPEDVHYLLLEPWTHPRTGETLPAPAERADPSGLLRGLLHLHFFTGHRAASIRNLRVGDVLYDVRDIREKLRACGGVHRPDWAEVFAEHGALYWSPEVDKESYQRVTPISRHLRPLLDAQLEALPSREPDAPLFPSPQDPTQPVGPTTIVGTRCLREDQRWKIRPGGWLTEALYLVRAQLAVEGRDPDELIPLEVDEDRRGVGKANLPWKLHGYRRLYATLLERLGYGQKQAGEDRVDLDRHASFLGGWSILGEGVKEERYIDLDPVILTAAADFVEAMKALEHRAERQARSVEEGMGRIRRSEELRAETGSNGEGA